MPGPISILVALIAFVGGWGLSLVWRGLFPASKLGKPELGRCPACAKPLDYRGGLWCPCGNRARSAEDLFRPVRSAKIIALGMIVVGVGAALIAALPRVRAWIEWDSSDAPAGLWTAGAWGIAAFAGLIIVRGLVGEPARGRRRCPRCWYDLLIDTRTCSECGFTSEHERAFYRRRRRARPVYAGLVLLALSYGVFVTPRVREGGWIAAVPTAVLIAGFAWLPPQYVSSGGSDWTLFDRCDREGLMSSWERTWLNSQMDAMISDPSSWKLESIMEVVKRRMGGREGNAVAALERALATPDTPTTSAGINALTGSLWSFRDWKRWQRSPESTPLIVAAMTDANQVRRFAALTLAQFPGPDVPRVADAVLSRARAITAPGAPFPGSVDEFDHVFGALAALTVTDPDRTEAALDSGLYPGMNGPGWLWQFLLVQEWRGGRAHHSAKARDLILAELPSARGSVGAGLVRFYVSAGHELDPLLSVIAKLARDDEAATRSLVYGLTGYREVGVLVLCRMIALVEPPARSFAIEMLFEGVRTGGNYWFTPDAKAAMLSLDPNDRRLTPIEAERIQAIHAAIAEYDRRAAPPPGAPP